MFYKYNENSQIIEKSETEFSENNAIHEADFDIENYVYIISKLDGDRIAYFFKKPRSAPVLIENMQIALKNTVAGIQAEYDDLILDHDFRLLILEQNLEGDITV